MDTPAWLQALSRRELRPGTWTLEVILELCRRLGDPQDAFPSLHVAGTRGKGSTCALAEAALREAGFLTGLTTSPHLLSPCERIRVGGLPVALERLVRLADSVRAAGAEELDAGYFEVMTAAAFLAFAEARVDVAIVEVGLGGRVDATNVIRPLVGVITRLGLDHADRLGGTRASVAAEKAGILKPGMRGVLAVNDPEASAVVAARAAQLMVPLRFVTRADIDRAPAVALPGAVQAENAAAAMVALEELGAATSSALLAPPEAMARGFCRVRWRARLELLPRALGDADLLLDVAHDVDGARALVAHVGEGVPAAIVFACLSDKDAAGIASELLASPALRTAPVLVPQLSGPRARPARALAGLLAERGLDAREAPSVAAALDGARALASRAPDASQLVVAFGSFHLAGDVLRALGVTEI